jgi:two-component system response regulator VicR
MVARIALVSAYQETAPVVVEALAQTGYEVVSFLASPAVHEDVRASEPHLVIYDCGPRDGFHEGIFMRVRNSVEVPMLVVGHRYSEAFVVDVLKLGADDCVCRPYTQHELRARVNAHLRRFWQWGQQSEVSAEDEPIIDYTNYSVVISGQDIQLTPAECRLLSYLVDRAGEVVTNQELCECIWGSKKRDMAPNLRLCIHNLRNKLEQDPHNPRYLMTKRGAGYYWRQLVTSR